MFNKILIANRGEIACRVMETAQSHGRKVLRGGLLRCGCGRPSMWQMADQAVHIGGAAPAESYLKGDVIIQLRRSETGAQAIHPGYGFLSENPDFVEAVDRPRASMFIGPSADAIRKMGLKDAGQGADGSRRACPWCPAITATIRTARFSPPSCREDRLSGTDQGGCRWRR